MEMKINKANDESWKGKHCALSMRKLLQKYDI